MTLKPENAAQGLWRSDPPRQTGAHALVIGVSDYPYLGGGGAPPSERVQDPGGLLQLEVSALSGALIFEWLKDADEIAGAPLASCRLLLAPRPDEKERVDRLTDGHYGSADYDPMESALKAWSNDIAAGGRVQGPNVAVFFFSGHGVEFAASPVILARDVLNQTLADRGIGNALTVESMSTAIKTHDIDRALFFVDACRDSPKIARMLNLVGKQPLTPNPFPMRRVDALIRLHSTASGLKSYQAKQDRSTIFTQALLDGLNGPPPSYVPYDTTSIPWQLLFSALEGHVKRKVIDLLAGHSPLALQCVDNYGNPYDPRMLVARKSVFFPDAAIRPRTEATAPTVAISEAIETSAAKILDAARSLTASEIDAARGFSSTPVSDLADSGIMQMIFQHESITHRWIDSVAFLDTRTGQPASADTVRILGAYSQEIGSRMAAWIDMAVAPDPGTALWISAGGDQTAGIDSSAVVIPQDRYHPIPARLVVTFERRNDAWTLFTMSARLCDPARLEQPVVTQLWMPLWNAQRTEALSDLASAGRAAAQLDLQAAVDHNSGSPIAAAMAINFLLRSGDFEYLLDWPRDLAYRFEWLPDGPVLWAETLLRQQEIRGTPPSAEPSADEQEARIRRLRAIAQDPEQREAREYYCMLAERGAPLLANSLAIALRQAVVWRQLLEAGLLTGTEEYRLAQALGNVDRAGRYAASGTDFGRFISPDAVIGPEAVLGHRVAPLRRAAE